MSIRQIARRGALFIPGVRALSQKLDRLREDNARLVSERSADRELMSQQAAAVAALAAQLETSQAANDALKARLDGQELELYVARSDQQRIAALADGLRAQVAASRTGV